MEACPLKSNTHLIYHTDNLAVDTNLYYIYTGRQELGLAELETAVELNPNDADVLADYGYYVGYLGKAEEGLEFALKAMRLNPHHPEYYLWQLGQIYHEARQYKKAIAAL